MKRYYFNAKTGKYVRCARWEPGNRFATKYTHSAVEGRLRTLEDYAKNMNEQLVSFSHYVGLEIKKS